MRVPVTLTRSPTWLANFSLLVDVLSTTETDAEPLCRKPDFQLRAFGASSPSVFFRRKASSFCSRQPVMVTGATTRPESAFEPYAGATGAAVDVSAVFAVFVAAVADEGPRDAMRIAAVTKIITTTTAAARGAVKNRDT